MAPSEFVQTVRDVVQAARDIFSIVWPLVLLVSGAVTTLVNRLSPEAKQALITARPYLAGAFDLLAAVGYNAPQAKRGASGLRHGSMAPANLEARRVVESEEDIDGVTLTPAQPLLPAHLRAVHASEHFVLVQSKPPRPPSEAVTIPPMVAPPPPTLKE